MKIFTGTQIRELDKYTISHEPIKSIDLMERAARTVVREINALWTNDVPFVVFAGPGNNGGDALAVARMLSEQRYNVTTYLFNIKGRLSEDCTINKQRLEESKYVKNFKEITNEFDPPQLERGMVVIDGLFGSGLNKPLVGGFASLVKYINQSPATKVSIDMPSGLMTEDNTYNVRSNIIQADYTFTFHQIKLSFLFPENQQFLGNYKVLDIGISKEAENETSSCYSFVNESDILPLLLTRNNYAHKGDMGKALLVAGSYGMAGAAVLAAKSCLKSGVGKLTIRTPKRNNSILQVAVPEAMTSIDKDDLMFTEAIDASDYDAMGVGPGLGTSETTAIAFISQLRRTQAPIVSDADGLNILSSHRTWLQQLPKGIIMTPHPIEFERLAGNHFNDSFERLANARDMAERINAYIILKGHYSALCVPNGNVVFNTTGNAGMATAGSGDVLTGIITGLLARGYKQADACMIGMYVHGLAGDIAAERLGQESLTSGDIVNFLPNAFKYMYDRGKEENVI